ncbi:unnamed protein product [Pleuronectes platessa]|uniref:Uncharacterized protein n=1 Tax=Pleuronectes platessa TaxID=8262 RepID=A0A9N7UBK3_PLEPL|nr:unnamed protein product [Pleuronectes platessa]
MEPAVVPGEHKVIFPPPSNHRQDQYTTETLCDLIARNSGNLSSYMVSLRLPPLSFLKAQGSSGGSLPAWNKHTKIDSGREREEGKRPDGRHSHLTLRKNTKKYISENEVKMLMLASLGTEADDA